MAGLLNGKQLMDKTVSARKLAETYLPVEGGTITGDLTVTGNTTLSDKATYKGAEIANRDDLYDDTAVKELINELEQKKQDKLTAGDHITLSDSDVVGVDYDGLQDQLLQDQFIKTDSLSDYYTKPQVDNIIDNLDVDHAVTAYRLATPRTINGVEFDGTKNITIHSLIPQYILPESNLNDYKQPGMYYMDVNVHAETIENNPTQYCFSLLVEKHAGVKQTLTTYLPEYSQTYIRHYYEYRDFWGEWYRVFTEADPPPVGDATKLATPRNIWGQPFDGSQDITGDLTSEGKIYTDISVYTGGKKEFDDGLTGSVLGSNGCLILTAKENPEIAFYRENSTWRTGILANTGDKELTVSDNLIIENNLTTKNNIFSENYMYAQGSIYSGGKRAYYDGHVGGGVAASGNLVLCAEENTRIIFYNENATSPTSTICEVENGLLEVSGKLDVVGGITTTSLIQTGPYTTYFELDLRSKINSQKSYTKKVLLLHPLDADIYPISPEGHHLIQGEFCINRYRYQGGSGSVTLKVDSSSGYSLSWGTLPSMTVLNSSGSTFTSANTNNEENTISFCECMYEGTPYRAIYFSGSQVVEYVGFSGKVYNVDDNFGKVIEYYQFYNHSMAEPADEILNEEIYESIELKDERYIEQHIQVGSSSIYGDLVVGRKKSPSDGKSGVYINSAGGIEMSNATAPYLDFHYANSTEDYTSRISETAKGVLTVSNDLIVNKDLTVNGLTSFSQRPTVNGVQLATVEDIAALRNLLAGENLQL